MGWRAVDGGPVGRDNVFATVVPTEWVLRALRGLTDRHRSTGPQPLTEEGVAIVARLLQALCPAPLHQPM